MFSQTRALRFAAIVATITALTLFTGCAPKTPETVLAEAHDAIQMGDFYEAEILFDKLFAMEGLDDQTAVEAHMARATNFIRGLQDRERALEEMEAVLQLATPNSDFGMAALVALLNAATADGGIGAWETRQEELLAGTELTPERALSLDLRHWETMLMTNSSPEAKEFFPVLWEKAATAEQLNTNERRDLQLGLARTRALLAIEENDLDSAIEFFNLFIEAHPDSEPALFMPIEMSRHLKEAGREEESQALMAEGFARFDERIQAAESSEEVATTRLMLADAYVWTDQIDEANAAYLAFFDEFPDFQLRPLKMLDWSVSLARNGSMEEAQDLLTRATIEYPNTPISGQAMQLLQAIDLEMQRQAMAAAAAAAASGEAMMMAPASPEASL